MAELMPPSVSAAGSGPQKTTGGRALARKPKKTAKKVAAPHGIPTSGDRLAQWLADPGLRSRLPDSALPQNLLALRQQNTYNASPAAPGSSYTNHDLNSLIDLMARQKYGQAETALGQQQKNVPTWFQAYRDQIAAAQKAENAAAAQQVGSLQTMATNAAGDTGGFSDPVATAAAAIRSAGIGNQAALAQNLAGNQNSYLTDVGLNSFGLQRGAMDKVAQQISQLALDKGDFKTSQRQSILSDEADSALKNALTQAQIGSQTANAAATKASTQKTKVETTKSKADQAYFKAHGYYPKTGPTAPKSPDVITSGAFAGYTKAQVAKMAPDKKDQLKSDFAKKPGTKAGKSAFLPQTSQNSFKDQLDAAIAAAKKRKSLGEGRHDAAQLLLNGRAATTVDHNGTKVKVPAVSKIPQDILTAALDAVYDGHLSRATIKKLHARGIKVNPLGVSTKAPKPQALMDSGISGSANVGIG